MDYRAREAIENFTSEIRGLYSINTPIDDIAEIVELLGGTIEDDDSLSIYANGYIVKQDNSFAIYLSPSLSLARKNFTIAHELGHLFLHMGYATDEWNEIENNVSYHRHGANELEYQANEFAASLLMPKEEYLDKIKQHAINNKIDISIIARYFNVSNDVAVNRGKRLSCLKWK